jgi:apolipoprotein N-acyltransferase
MKRPMILSMKKRILMVIASAALLVWSFPHTDQGWLAWVALIPSLLAIDGQGLKKGFWLGWLFGFTFMFFVGDWFSLFGWEPRLLVALHFGLFQAVFFALWGWLSARHPGGLSWQRILLPPLLWTALEWLKSQGVLAFQWGFLGYTQYKFPLLVQLCKITGTFGISFLIVSFSNLLCETFHALLHWKSQPAREGGSVETPMEFVRGIPAALLEMGRHGREFAALRFAWVEFVMIFLLVMVFGRISIPLETKIGAYEEVFRSPVRVGVVQPNVPQDVKHKSDSILPTLQAVSQETDVLAGQGASMVIWPETVILHSRPLEDPATSPGITGSAARNRIYLLTGLIDREKDRYYNSAFLLGPDGRVVDISHKMQLVPMSEYFPLPEKYRKYKLFDRIGNYSHGQRQVIFKAPFGSFAALICFESMFDLMSRKAVKDGADFLVVITNDAWFGKSNLAKTHFIMGMFRAAENNVWLVQAGNTGISGIIDPWGKPVTMTDIFVKTSFSGVIYTDIGSGRGTFYTRAGNWFPALCLVIALCIILASLLQGRKAAGPPPGGEEGGNRPDPAEEA